MTRRAFTLMETMMAAALGSLVILLALGLFASMDKTDRSTALRFDQTSALSRVHLVMTRTFGNIVMSDSSVTGIGLPQQPQPAQPEGQQTSPMDPTARPRILLQQDQSPALNLSSRGGSSQARPQRLEVVVGKSPVPSVLDSRGGEAIAMAAFDPDVYTGPAVRGVFELRPDPAGERAKGWGVPGLDPRYPGWTLWWRPLPHREEGPERALFSMAPEEDPRAVPIASGLQVCRWTAFSKRKRGDSFKATQFQELPAYMELEVRTTSGLTANWMFEVDWTNGPETQEELEAIQASGPGALAGAGAGGTGGGAKGAAGGADGAPSKDDGGVKRGVLDKKTILDTRGRDTFTGREAELQKMRDEQMRKEQQRRRAR
jgi:hypothetical protein